MKEEIVLFHVKEDGIIIIRQPAYGAGCTKDRRPFFTIASPDFCPVSQYERSSSDSSESAAAVPNVLNPGTYRVIK